MRKFLASLEPDKRKAASFAWNGPEWSAWNYFGVGGYIKPGLRLEQMSAAQKAAAWDLLATWLSPGGLAKTKNVMMLQDVLAASGNGTGQRSSERFSFSVFGTPAETGAWGFRLEGHHLTQSIAVRDNRIVSVTPSSFSALPNRITQRNACRPGDAQGRGGAGATAGRRSRAQAAGEGAPVGSRRSATSCPMPAASAPMRRRRGSPAAELASAQRDLVWQLIDTYAVDYLSPALAAAQRARVRSGDRDAVHFAWYGPNTPEKAFGYRVIGDGFVIELGSVDPAAQHLHTIYNDLGNVLGRTA